MADWSLLGNFLEEVQEHSTSVGKVWLTILFIFRILVLGTAAESSWGDEQEDFNCDTQQPGCENVCYDRAFPIAHIRYWVLQIVFVSTPSLIYMGHAMHTVRQQEKRGVRGVVQEDPGGGGGGREKPPAAERERGEERVCIGRIQLRGPLLHTYILSILIRSVMEVVFLCLQYFLYGIFLHPLYVCRAWPCPHPVNCFISRPTEKNVFIVFMLVVSAVSLALSVLELHHLVWRHCCRQLLTSGRSAAVTGDAPLASHVLAPPPPSTPPPDFSQCIIGSTHFVPLPLTHHHRLADRQNSENMAAEMHKMAAVAEENFLQMSIFPPDGGFLQVGSDRCTALDTAASCAPIQNGGLAGLVLSPNGGLLQKDKRRLSKTSGSSGRTRTDDLAV